VGSEAGWGVPWYVFFSFFGLYLYLGDVSWANLTIISEVKALKSLVRNVIAPERDLGHTDRALKKLQSEQEKEGEEGKDKDKAGCEDCK
jgi:hypothetical protein